jgi:hypothetical protein
MSVRASQAKLLTYTVISVSSENADFLKENIAKNTEPTLTSRTTSIGSDQWWVVDFGSAKAVDAFFLDKLNFATVKIQGNATDDWVGPSFDSGFLTVERDFRHDRYKIIFVTALFNLRFARILVPAGTPVDGSSYFEIGGLSCSDDYVELNENFQLPASYGQDEPSKIIAYESGRQAIISLGPSMLNITYGGSFRKNSANWSQFYNIFGDSGRSRPILIDRNRGNSWEAFLVRRAAALEETERTGEGYELFNMSINLNVI